MIITTRLLPRPRPARHRYALAIASPMLLTQEQEAFVPADHSGESTYKLSASESPAKPVRVSFLR